jgi:hypothetical protein
MFVGETSRYHCKACLTEFEITLEPQSRDWPESAKPAVGAPGKPVECCPCCGTRALMESTSSVQELRCAA